MNVVISVLIATLQISAHLKYTVNGEKLIDPSGWNYDRVSKDWKSEDNDDFKTKLLSCEQSLANCQRNVCIPCTDNIIVKEVEQESSRTQEEKKSDIFYRRFVRLLLNSARLSSDSIKDDIAIGSIEIRISVEQMKILTDFSESRSDISLRELDTILSETIQENHSFVYDTSVSWLKFFEKREVWLCFAAIGFFVLVWRLIWTIRTVSKVITIVILLIFTGGYIIEYYRMYQEMLVKQKVHLSKESIPSCDISKESWFTRLFSFQKDECEDYYRALMIDPLVEVSPVRVLSSVLTDFVVHPTEKVAKAIAIFATSITGSLPFYYGWFVYIFSSFGVVIIFVVILLLLSGVSMNFRSPLMGVNIRRDSTPRLKTSVESCKESSSDQIALENEEKKLPLPPQSLFSIGPSGSIILLDSNSIKDVLTSVRNNSHHHRNVIEDLNVPNTTCATCSGTLLPVNTEKKQEKGVKLQQECQDKTINEDPQKAANTSICKERKDLKRVASVPALLTDFTDKVERKKEDISDKVGQND